MFRKIIGRIFLKKKEEVEVEKEIEELPETEVPKAKLQVRVVNLTGMADVDSIAKNIKSGDILFLKIKELQKRNLGQFQNILQKVKRFSVQFGWNMALVEEGYLIVAPSRIKIER